MVGDEAMESAELRDVFWEGRGRYVLWASPKRPISLNGYAPGGRARFDQIERAVRTGIREQPRALADDHGIDDEVELVDQVIGEQPSEKDTAAGHNHVAVLLRFQITDGHGDVARQDSRARPLRVGEGGLCHVLGPAIQCGADRACGHFAYRSPGAGEDLVCRLLLEKKKKEKAMAGVVEEWGKESEEQAGIGAKEIETKGRTEEKTG